MTDLVKSSANVPAYLEDFENEGTENIRPSNSLQRLKVIQDNRKGDYRDFPPRSIVMTPDLICLYDGGDANVQPIGMEILFHFSLFSKWEPMVAGSDNPVIEATTDEESEVARKAMDSKTWFEYHPEHPKGEQDADKWRRRYVHSLVFVVMVDDVPLPCLMSFSRGDFRHGKKLGNHILMRKAPIWSQRFKVSTKLRSNKSGQEWWGYDVVTDTDQPFVDESKAPSNRAAYLQLKELYEKGGLGTREDAQDSVSDDEEESSDSLD